MYLFALRCCQKVLSGAVQLLAGGVRVLFLSPSTPLDRTGRKKQK